MRIIGKMSAKVFISTKKENFKYVVAAGVELGYLGS